MILRVKENNVEVSVELAEVTEEDFQKIVAHLRLMIETRNKNREAISSTFLFAVKRCPRANPSDLWHHVIYRTYLKSHMLSNPQQSWVRTSGEALEEFLSFHYNPVLNPHGLRLMSLVSRAAKTEALETMGLAGKVGNSKLDVLIEKQKGKGLLQILGGIHVKASLAERVSDDVPASQAMMQAGYLSILWTLDVKSFPPPHGDLVNRGEFGTVKSPSDKRLYIEQHGSFDACFSFNLRSVPSPAKTSSGKRIYVQPLIPQPDAFVQYVLEYAKGH